MQQRRVEAVELLERLGRLERLLQVLFVRLWMHQSKPDAWAI